MQRASKHLKVSVITQAQTKWIATPIQTIKKRWVRQGEAVGAQCSDAAGKWN